MNEKWSNLNVYYNSLFVGHLTKTKHQNSDEYAFTYTQEYVESDQTVPLGVNLPKSFEAYSCKDKLPPFFDNLVSEGWLRENQSKALNKQDFKGDKFDILSYFGFDLIGSVSIKQDQNYNKLCPPHFDYIRSLSDSQDSNLSQASCVSIDSNSTISGVQKKVLVKKIYSEFCLTTVDQLSTHIAKLESERFPHLIELEYLSTRVMKILLPNDQIHNVQIDFIHELMENALIVERFDRYYSNGIVKRKHFEEFNQLLDMHSEDKYNFSYDEMGHFMRNSRLCKHEDLLKLFKRILACILIGNTDAHLKNFAMFHNHDGSLSLTPMYDIVASSFYPQLNTLALTLNGKKDAIINDLKPKQIVEFALNPKGFGLNAELLIEIIDEFNIYKQQAYFFLENENTNEKVQKKLAEMIHRRWNGSFEGVKSYLDKRKNRKTSK
ncbi:unnamed protein product [Brachionus calyciflorus]|uniref:Phosphatidylinositol kinase n=1 Tax=Brachionus calyciflorus TaxID=104777 RepID=A0A814LST6_9BILA|nr:unnamed protein product [Brachionus calyciflorus]